MRCLLLSLLIVGCNYTESPTVSSNVVQVKALNDHNVSVQSYQVPEGVLRGALWPSPNNENFQIWLIDGDKELFYDISPPSGFNNYDKETTEDWSFDLSESAGTKQICVASRKDSSKSTQIELPMKKRAYSFYALRNQKGDELIVFMDTSETVRDKGLFGYVLFESSE